MSDIGKNALKTKIDNKVYENSSQAITGTIMNEVLQDMVDTLADGGNLDAGSVNTANIADGAVTDAKLQNPVSVSQNTLTIGGNYAGEMSATYDVTLHNSGATFASLEALLSDANLNTLIPTDVRKGGMSIKFVRSSDNKYVQYSYMEMDATTTATFTNTVNWQGADDILNSVDDSCKKVTESITPQIKFDGSYIDWSTGNNSPYEPYAISDGITLHKGDKLVYICGANDLVSVLALVTPTDGRYIPLVQGNPSGALTSRTYVATEDCTVAISYQKSLGLTCEIHYYNIEREINLVDNKTTEIKLLLDTQVKDKVLNRLGAVVNSDGWSYGTNFIPYEQGKQVNWRYSVNSSNADACIIFYDSNYKKVEYWNASSASGEQRISASVIASACPTARYIRFSFKTDDFDSIYCEIGNVKYKTSGVIPEIDNLKKTAEKIASYKKNKVFYENAIVNADIDNSLKERILSAIKFVEIEGFSGKQNFVLTRISVTAASVSIPLYFSAGISRITDEQTLEEVCSFNYAVSDISDWAGLVECRAVLPNMNVINAKMFIELSELGSSLFDLTLVSSLSDDTFNLYGLDYSCSLPVELRYTIFKDAYIRYQCAFRNAIIRNLDTTRNYKLKVLSFDRQTGLLNIIFCTDENILSVISSQTYITDNPKGLKWVTIDGSQYLIDFDILNDENKTFAINAQTIAQAYDVTLLSGERDSNLSAGLEFELSYNNEPMRLLDCGQNSHNFYLACGNKLFKTSHITKQNYVSGDSALTLVCEFSDAKSQVDGVWEKNIAIYGVRELNTGKLLINSCVQTSTNEDFDNINRDGTGLGGVDRYSKFYLYNPQNNTLTFLFNGSWQGALYQGPDGGWVKRGGMATFVWDFFEWENYIFVTERAAQGLGGRAWMSNDYGTTWYVIFNAYGDNGWIYTNPPYPFINPSGFDAEHGDFDRRNPLNNRPYFHIHGIAYDHWRNQVIIVSGDLTWVQGSYTAVWVWKNPQNITLWPEESYTGYAGEEIYPIGGTKADNPVKMLANAWNRVGLHREDTGMEGDMQFVGCIPFKDVIAFSTDCNVKGGNGIIINTFPDNIVSSNFKIAYSLSPDSEGSTLTHCGGGVIFINNLCLCTFHRENSDGMIEGSERRGAVLESVDGRIWRRVFVDDTLNAELVTQIMWGATMIGKTDELYLRYKGFTLDDNKIRQMRLY